MKYKVVVIGGGIGGLEVIRELINNGFKENILLITEKDYYISGPSRPLILSNEQSLDRIIRGYNYLPENVDIIYSKVENIDLENRKVKIKNRKIEYEYLIIATGLKYDYSSININDRIYNVYDLGKLYDLKNLVWNIKEGSILVYAPKQPYRCAPAPGETILTIDMVLRYRRVRNDVKLIFVDANPKVQPPVIHDLWIKRFEEANIEYYLNSEIVEVNKDGIRLSNGEFIEAKYKVILPPNKANNPIGEGFIEVRNPKDLRVKDYDDVFAIGDVAKLPFPKNAEITMISARIAAKQILGLEVKENYKFIGWAYAGNLKGELETESIKFELEFTQEGPIGKKDEEPKKDYTKAKDTWEQAILKKLFGY